MRHLGQARTFYFLHCIDRGYAEDRRAAVARSAITRSICSPVTNGRTVSCTSTISVAAPPARAHWRRTAGACDCCELRAPGEPKAALGNLSARKRCRRRVW